MNVLHEGTVQEAIDAINARLGWSGGRLEPCAGHMVHHHEPVDGITVTIDADTVTVEIAGVVVATGARWRAVGNAYVTCLLPHRVTHVSSGLHQGGALNDIQLHLLTEHGTHTRACGSFRRGDRCRICQNADAERRRHGRE